MIIVCGDVNAHLGNNEVCHSFHVTNTNGRLLLNLPNECGFHIANTLYQKRKGKLWTFISNVSGVKSQIDFIMTNK